MPVVAGRRKMLVQYDVYHYNLSSLPALKGGLGGVSSSAKYFTPKLSFS